MSEAPDDAVETLVVGAPHGDAKAIAASLARYAVIEQVGHGGMGRVLRAYDPKLQREVALKEVRHDAGDAEAMARLLAEARAMAKLSHPNVVGVYDVEELDPEQVVLVMEFVEGQTLRTWLRERDRDWGEIVDRFVAAGRGLFAAHQAGLLHRDFKPANVLIGRDGSVKVTDFGIAKSTDTQSLHPSFEPDVFDEALTQDGMVMGTPRYMAPEQHADRELGPATDQYAFCVALWEALSGAPPFHGGNLFADKSSGPPAWPGGPAPRRIAHALARGLAPDPIQRWPSMQALLDALAPDGHRRRARWGAASLGVIVLAAAGLGYRSNASAPCRDATRRLGGIWDEGRRAEVREAMLAIDASYAESVWERTDADLRTYADAWTTMRTEACEATRIRGEQSPHMLDLRMACLDRIALDLRATVDLLAETDGALLRRAHELLGGLPPVDQCADTQRLAADVEPPSDDEADAVDHARAFIARSRSLEDAGRYEAALRAVEEAKTIARDIAYGPLLAELAGREGSIQEHFEDDEAAIAAFERALRLAARHEQWDVLKRVSAQLIYTLGYKLQRFDEAMRYRSLAEGLSKSDPRAEAHWRSNVASVLMAQGKYPEAEVEARIALEKRLVTEEEPGLSSARNNLAVILFRQGKYEEAEAEFRAALESRRDALGPHHPVLAVSRNNLGLLYRRQGMLEEAETEYRAALALWEPAFGPEDRKVIGVRNNIANALGDRGALAEAEAQFRDILELQHRSLGPDHPDTAMARNNLGSILSQRGETAAAEAEYRAALESMLRTLGADHPNVALFRNNLAVFLFDQERYEDALPLAEAAWKRRREEDIPAHQRASTAYLLADISWQLGRDHERARSLAEVALEGFRDAQMSAQANDVQRWLDEHPLPQ